MSNSADSAGKKPLASINLDSTSQENSPLLKNVPTRQRSFRERYKNSRKSPTSKGALAILLWSFTAFILYSYIFYPVPLSQTRFDKQTFQANVFVYSIMAFVACFYPLAGYLADNKFGRYKTVSFGLWMLLPSFLFIVPILSLALVASYLIRMPTIIFVYGATIIFIILLAISSVSFNSNVIQFGVDQLYNYPSEDQSLFIHWFVWTLYLASIFVQVFWTLTLSPSGILETEHRSLHIIGESGIVLLGLLFIILLGCSLFIVHCKKQWFLIEPGRLNPYKLVYQVTKFAWKHKVPIKRSAFTYCEDEIPSGLNLAKNKYGGPFTTEQVEDVKVFFGILKVLFALGPIFFLTFAADVLLFQFSLHGEAPIINSSKLTHSVAAKRIFVHSGILTPLVTCICIPVYLLLLRPFLHHYIPGMLKRMGLGGVMMVLSLLCLLTIEVVSSVRYENKSCMFDPNSRANSANKPLNDSDSQIEPSHSTQYFDSAILVIPHVLQSFSNMLLYIGLYEFICSQSPHSMKGLLIGLSFAIRGMFHLLAASLVLPFALVPFSGKVTCGAAYYSCNVGIGFIALIVYVLISRKYQNRVRDEPSNVYMYAENYYSKIIEER